MLELLQGLCHLAEVCRAASGETAVGVGANVFRRVCYYHSK
ncbi:hypothetical protein HSB1_26600 [Halogranum salarium B-1]|uniref:Uncharacterized protein n=1 Tax=Halogranum salarium B-1 TaxID=1210908 RepID=J3JFG6_9EURY|nr:hypothetical protein HSB1_26600 [Halogranum salarium B-1]